jgi:hypothetical protein
LRGNDDFWRIVLGLGRFFACAAPPNIAMAKAADEV